MMDFTAADLHTAVVSLMVWVVVQAFLEGIAKPFLGQLGRRVYILVDKSTGDVLVDHPMTEEEMDRMDWDSTFGEPFNLN